MKRPPLVAAALALCATIFLPLARTAAGDVVVLKDGSRVEGDLERVEDGYNVTTADGKSVKVKSAQVKSVEVKAPATADEAQKRLDALRRSADNLADLKLIVSRYNDFLRRFGNTPQAEEARRDLAAWQEKLERHATKVAGKWVTPDELGRLQQESQEAAVKARDHVAQGRLREAGPLLQQALDVDPKNASALYLRGVVLFRQDQLGPARKAFDSVTKLVPDHAPTLNNLAVILWRQEGHAGALRYFDQAMAAAGDNGPFAEAVLNNVAEALHALPQNLRDNPATKRVVLHFQQRDEALAKRMQKRGLYRWGSSWVDGAQLDKLQTKENEIAARIKDLEAEFDTVQRRLAQVERDIVDTQRTLRRMEATSYVQGGPGGGRTQQFAPPKVYYGLKRDLEDLKREYAEQESRVNALRREAKLVKQELPVPRYSGIQRIIDADGTPLMDAAAATQPAKPEAPAPSSLPLPPGEGRGEGAQE